MSEIMKQALTNKSARTSEGLVLVAAGEASVNFYYWA